MEAEDKDPFEGTKKTIYVAKNTPAVVTVPGTGGDLHDDDPMSAVRIREAARAGVEMGAEKRIALMQEIGARFGVPPEGFTTGLSRIYEYRDIPEKGHIPRIRDIRFEQWLRRLSQAQPSRAAAANLKRTREVIDGIDIFLVLATTARESQGLTARDSQMVDTFDAGGMDFLDDIKNHLGLPKSIVEHWAPGTSGISAETHHEVHPSRIPMRDQILGYAAVTRLYFKNFEAHVRREIGEAQAQTLLDSLSKDATRVWQAYSFVAHGGAPFDPKVGPHHGQGFGVIPAFGYLRHLASQAGMPFDMNAILTTPSLHHTDYVKVAKARAMEATLFEELLTTGQMATVQ
jgi:hypothetical protein